MRFLPALGLVLACSAMGAGIDDEVFMGLQWGAGVNSVMSALKGLEPDLCSGDDRAYYKAMNWSCEGFVRRGHQMGGLLVDARVRMSEDLYVLANVTMTGVIEGTGSDGTRSQLFVRACDGLVRNLESSFGEGRVRAMTRARGAVNYVVFFESRKKQTRASLKCMDVPGEDRGELVVSLEPTGQSNASL